MDQKTIFSKTGKGVLEIKNKAGKLSKDLVKVLTLIDGKSSVADVVAKSKFSVGDITRFIKQLEDAGYVKEFNNPSSSSYEAAPTESSYVDDLDFTASLPPGKRIYQSGQAEFRQQESAARIQAEAEAKRKREEEEKRKREEAERQARDEAARMAKIEAERKAKEAAAMKARLEAERKAQIQAEEMSQTTRDLAKVLEAERKALEAGDLKKKEEAARKAAEDAQRKATEDAERARREGEDRKRQEEERKRREEEDSKRKEEEERRRREEEERKRKEEEERRRREEEERKRKEEEERKRREEEERKRKEEEERKRQEEKARLEREEEDRKRREEEDRRREEEDQRRRDEDDRRRREDEERRQREDSETLGREDEERLRREQEDSRRREEDERRALEEQQHRRDEEERRRGEDEERSRKDDDDARRRVEAAAISVDLQPFDLPKTEDSGSFLESFDRQQEALKQQAAEDERKRREMDEALAAAERAEREEIARQEAERRAEEEAERRERVEREESERKERERKKAEEYESKIKGEEERKRKEAEEKKRAEAARIDNERRAREEELARKRKEAEERERKQRELKALGKQGKVRSPLDRLKPVLIGAVAVVVLAVAAVQFMPMSGYIPAVEKLASEHIQEPVSIQSMRISALSGFDITLENVKIGTTQDVSLSSVTLSPEIGSLFGGRKVIRTIKAEGGTVAREVLSRLPKWLDASVADKSVQVGEIRLVGIKPDMRDFDLPAMDADIRLNPDQTIRQARVATSDGKLSVEVVPNGAELQVAITGSNWTPPLGPPLELLDLNAKGVISGSTLRVSEWDARLYEGVAKGKAEISWRDGWAAQTEFEFARIEVARLLAVFTRTARTSGLAEGKGSISLQANTLPALFDNPRAELSFVAKRGNVDGVDLVRALQSGREGTQGGSTKFEELSGTLTLANGRYQYRNLRLGAGILTASGSFDIAPNQEVGGRIYVELRSQAQQLRNNLNVTGSLQGILLRP
jgi:hypothetical protein